MHLLSPLQILMGKWDTIYYLKVLKRCPVEFFFPLVAQWNNVFTSGPLLCLYRSRTHMDASVSHHRWCKLGGGDHARTAAMQQQRQWRRKDCDSANMDVNKVQNKIFKNSALQIFYEEENTFSTFVRPYRYIRCILVNTPNNTNITTIQWSK